MVRELLPSSDYDEVSAWMEETSEMSGMLIRVDLFPWVQLWNLAYT